MINNEQNKENERFDQIMQNDPDEKEKKRKSQADKLVELVKNSEATLFKNQYGEPYARIFVKGHFEIYKIRSRHFQIWLTGELWRAENKAANSNAISSALNIIESEACHEGETISLGIRIVQNEKVIWYDCTDDQWRTIKIYENGWEINTKPPILFQRYSHQKAQIEPQRGGDIKEILKFVNISKHGQDLLLLIYLVSCFVPNIPHPILIFWGPQGASKTTLAKMLRSLIDPSTVGVLSMPNTANDLVQQLAHHLFAFFDNMTHMPDWVSDAFCRAVTGEGATKRELFSNDDDIIYAYKRCVGVNGINLVARKSDLLDRSIIIKLDRISKENRMTEQEIWQKFEIAKPSIFGGILDVLSKAMKLVETIELKDKPRMADFAVWGCAIALAMGYTQEDFTTAYYENIDNQHNEAIQENPVAIAVIALMEKSQKWEGSASELLDQLNEIAEVEKLDFKGRGWPKAPNSLSRRLNEAKTNLSEIGITIDSEKISNGRRNVKIEKLDKNIVKAISNDEENLIRQVFGENIKISTEPISPQQSSLNEGLTDPENDIGDISSKF